MPPRKAIAVNTRSSRMSSRATMATKTNTGKRAASPERTSAPSKRARKENSAVQLTDSRTKRTKTSTTDEARNEVPKKRADQEKIATITAPLAPHVPPNPLNPLPTPPPHSRPAVQIFFWGAGNFGQFGMGPDALGEFDKPRKHTWVEQGLASGKFGGEGAGIESAAAGGMHTIFVDEAGKIWTCGVNDDAALGRPVKDVPDPDNPGKFLDVDLLTSVPHKIQTLEDEGFRAVQVAAGDNIGAALGSDGSLRVWGTFKSKEGSLGFSSHHKHQWEPVPVLPNKTALNKPEACVAIASGNNHILVLTVSGDIFAWGDGEQGQLGRKVLERTKIHGLTPERVIIGSRNKRFKVIGAGLFTSFAVDVDGEIWAWGLNNMGQLGTNESYDDEEFVVATPTQIDALSPQHLNGDRVVQISGGEHHTLFLTSGGRVFSCGRAEGGQLGLADTHPLMKARSESLEGKPADMIITPSEVEFPEDAAMDPIIRIETGIRNNVAISRDGALYSWGEGNQGELGLGEDQTNARIPTVVVRRTGGSWSAVGASCGGQHTIGLFRKKA